MVIIYQPLFGSNSNGRQFAKTINIDVEEPGGVRQSPNFSPECFSANGNMGQLFRGLLWNRLNTLDSLYSVTSNNAVK